MTDKPILFNGPTIRAILDDRKTQTRRVLKRTKDGFETLKFRCGDRFWVRETCFAYETSDGMDGVHFTADHCFVPIQNTMEAGEKWGRLYHYRNAPKTGGSGHTVPAIHMPRWASRITLVVTDVRVQRLQDINEIDAINEGCRPFFDAQDTQIIKGPNGHKHEMMPLKGPIDDFRKLWDGLNEKRGFGWSENPWVAAYTFEVHRCNIDQMGAVR